MAPSKKKRKPQSNPARGFATTSTISKAQIQESQVSSTEQQLDVPTNNDLSQTRSSHDEQHPDNIRELKDLTPEELEKQLEETELQSLVDQHGEKVQRNATRQVSRLQTERRLLRSNADPLKVESWISSDIVDHIIKSGDSKTHSFGHQTMRTEDPVRNVLNPEDDLLIKAWTLYESLPRIGFSEAQTWSALQELFQQDHDISSDSSKSSKETIWGLEQCLDWKAHACDSKYTTLDGTVSDKTPTASSDDVKRLEADDIQSKFGEASPEKFTAQHEIQSQTLPSLINTSSTSSESDSDWDSDLEPDQMIEKYLSLRTKRFHLEPQLGKKVGKSSHGSTDSPGKPVRLSKRLDRIDAKLMKLKSDILFDDYDAELRWNSAQIQLNKQAAERRRMGIVGEEETNRKRRSALKQPEPPTSSKNQDNDSDDLLGELFSSLPSTENTTAGERDVLKTTGSTGQEIKIRDYGSWNGISPRRILEEACKARDSASQISYDSISQSTFSNRHTVCVRWSRSQDIPSPIIIPGLLVSFHDRASRVSMEDVACVNRLQSEAYVSTVLMFLVFSLSSREEKCHLRLPPTWRDLWQELCTLRKEQNDVASRDTLKKLRAVIGKKHLHKSQVGVEPLNDNVQAIRSPETNTGRQTNRLGAVSDAHGESVRFSWESIVASHSYHAMLESRKTLPIWSYKQELLHSFERHPIVIVCGETGCGKSTQIPAFILEQELSAGRPCKIICTEPRRISAISLAQRVSQELGERRGEVGTANSLVGYAIRLESQMTPHTRLVYATTGIVMRMLEGPNKLDDVTHLVLDEVHERTIESDFLLIILRKMMQERPQMRIILMSATVDAERLSQYLNQAPVFNIPGRTFPVEVRYLEDAIEALKITKGSSKASEYDMDVSEGDEDTDMEVPPKASLDIKNYSATTQEVLANYNEYRIDYTLLVRLLQMIATENTYFAYSKAILVFMPGIAEIRRLCDMILGNAVFTTGWNIHPLHSAIATEEQERAFHVPALGTRKIVIATNIAETGITIPDVTCVIDTGKHKEMRFDEKKQLSRLIESFISRANAKQRRGRAGRVQEGLCFHMYTKYRHDNIMSDQQTPEMLRLSLQDLVLRVKLCKLGGIEQTLSEALDPPSAKNVRRAVDALIDVKALTSAEELTPLGRQLAKLPLDVFLGKLVLLGTIFSCLDAALTAAAILSSKSPFYAPLGARPKADMARMAFNKGDSDILTVYNAYCAWKRVCVTNGPSEQQYCRTNFLNPQTLASIEDLKGQMLSGLADAGFVTLTASEKDALSKVRFASRRRTFIQVPPQHNSNSLNELILKSVIAWSFYPKLLRKDGRGWRSVANNQNVSLHPASVNKGIAARWLSFYHILQSSSKFYNALETSTVEDFAIALLCGDADFKMYSGVIVIDGNRVRFSVNDWKKMLALRTLRIQLQQIVSQSFKRPGVPLSAKQREWMDIWQEMFSQGESTNSEQTSKKRL